MDTNQEQIQSAVAATEQYAEIMSALRTLRDCTGNIRYGISDEEAKETHFDLMNDAFGNQTVAEEQKKLEQGRHWYKQGYRLHLSTQRWMQGHAHTIDKIRGCIYREIVDCGYVACSPQKTLEYLTK
ncbi:hypothetical protein LCGC14_2124880 [marine sediment metagenome]|uniref:Uncharacterized protein n=1 Tax=marine sediment metagenome TaxID=412755 RepID=A0A0F9EQB4_9ZZZZ